MNAHSQVIRKALQLLLFAGMLLGVALLHPAPVAHGATTTQTCFALSNAAPDDLVNMLISAGYGNLNLYETLGQIVQDTNPSVVGIITPAFLQALRNSPAGSAIFTTLLSNVLASGNTVEICDDGTAQYKPFSGSFFAAQGFPTLVSSISGVGSANFTYSTDPNTPLSSWTIGSTTYNLFGIASAGQTCFALSNEGGQLISALISGGYGPDNLYQALVEIVADTNPSVAGIITPTFLTVLKYCPPSSEIFTTHLQDVLASGNAVEICTDGTAQYNTFSGSVFAAQGYPTLVSNISGAGYGSFTHSTDPNTPLTSWTVGSTTYELFGVAWGQPRYYLPLVTKSQ